MILAEGGESSVFSFLCLAERYAEHGPVATTLIERKDSSESMWLMAADSDPRATAICRGATNTVWSTGLRSARGSVPWPRRHRTLKAHDASQTHTV
jgi:hypothetical protein